MQGALEFFKGDQAPQVSGSPEMPAAHGIEHAPSPFRHRPESVERATHCAAPGIPQIHHDERSCLPPLARELPGLSRIGGVKNPVFDRKWYLRVGICVKFTHIL